MPISEILIVRFEEKPPCAYDSFEQATRARYYFYTIDDKIRPFTEPTLKPHNIHCCEYKPPFSSLQ